MIRLFLHARWYSKVLYCCSQEKKVYDGYCKDHVIIKSPWSTYYIHSLLHVFFISIFPYISYFEFLIQGLRKGEIKSILGFPKFSYYIKNPFQDSNVPKTCQCFTDNFLSSGFSLYFSKVWSLFTSWVSGRAQSKKCYFKCMLTF